MRDPRVPFGLALVSRLDRIHRDSSARAFPTRRSHSPLEDVPAHRAVAPLQPSYSVDSNSPMDIHRSTASFPSRGFEAEYYHLSLAHLSAFDFSQSDEPSGN
ncbi:hypothetical protein CORC01_10865 [Colletotrichum orchidophilum]|uniref:Uncharacterized protein n=1 Tax=Colletotrichum orchidophilum TaxID=1209926 RepID=A0A1G4AXH4_9PEZI|nr:uncharacterized protein CORC01_10865 [Colletotrichum orchidophilum]OHE93844.1 hypothetical protein CORC01_10865 [Colletotrichum orchidophilum]